MELLVFGAGALGSLLGGLLAREHDVTLVGREPHVSRVESDGLRIAGEIEAHVRPAATTDATGARSELALVTTKARDLDAARDALATGDHRIVLPLSNGLPEDGLRETLGDRVLGGTTTYGARLVEPGHVRCTGVGAVHVGEVGEGADDITTETEGEPSARAERVAAAFRAAGIDCTADGRMDRRRWEKLAVNAGINPVTALIRVENSALADGPAAAVAERAARETARVARAVGVEVSEERAARRTREVVETTAANHSSMLSDVERGRPTEVAAINGTVVERGEAVGVETPTNRTLFELVCAWEARHVE
ncbi:MAG: ketopantoate reductase family protein [Halobaculum sp.]